MNSGRYNSKGDKTHGHPPPIAKKEEKIELKLKIKILYPNQLSELSKLHPMPPRNHHGRDRTVVGFTTTCVTRAYHH